MQTAVWKKFPKNIIDNLGLVEKMLYFLYFCQKKIYKKDSTSENSEKYFKVYCVCKERLVENAFLFNKSLISSICLFIVIFLLTTNDFLHFYYTCSYCGVHVEIISSVFLLIKKLV